MKLLVAPRAAGTIAAMAGAGLFAPLVGGVTRPSRFARLAALDADAPDAALRLAGLLQFTREDADRLKTRLRLSNAEAGRLMAIGDMTPALAPSNGEHAAKVALYRLGPDAFRDRARLAWADLGAGPDDAGWASMASLPDRWRAPKLPVTAADFIERGVAPGRLWDGRSGRSRRLGSRRTSRLSRMNYAASSTPRRLKRRPDV